MHVGSAHSADVDARRLFQRCAYFADALRAACRWCLAQLLRECDDVTVGLRSEFLLEQLRVRARMLERARTIAGRVEPSHQSECNTGAVWIVRRQFPPPPD